MLNRILPGPEKHITLRSYPQLVSAESAGHNGTGFTYTNLIVTVFVVGHNS